MVDEERTITSSFHGDIDEIPDIAVDNFSDKTRMAYFLSHMHSDHTVGLFGRYNSQELRRNGAKIYMSEKSKIILSRNHWHYDNIEELVEPLKLGMTYTIDLTDDNAFEVTLIPVKHMIGAVMFLFKTKEKTVLYTGDFVIDRAEVPALKKLHDRNGRPLRLDTMYVDSTFDNPDYEYFPSRTECHNSIAEAIREWLGENQGGVSLFSNYQFGYDDMYIALKSMLNMRIFLNSSTTRQLYEELYGENGTPLTGNDSSRIHLCTNRDNLTTHTDCGISRRQNYLHVYISATRGYDYQPGRNNAFTREGPNSLYLCYPTHCSRNQLREFKGYFSPTRVVPFPDPVRTPNSQSPFGRDRRRPADDGDADRVRRRLNL